MVNARHVPYDALIKGLSEKFAGDKRVEVPSWVGFAKAGIHREKSWVQDDWYHIRLASTLRKVAFKGPIGISRLSADYGGRVDRGSQGYHPAKGSRFIVRHMFQTLEKLGYVSTEKRGRIISSKGQSLLDKTAREIIESRLKENPELKKLL